MSGSEEAGAVRRMPFEGIPRVMWPADAIQQDQGLLGAVFGTAVANLHECIAPILDAAGLPHHVAFNLAIRPKLDCARLAHVLRQPEIAVTTRRYAEVDAPTGPPMVDFFGAAVARYDLRFRERRIAPHRLAADPLPYHRAIWELGLVPFDLVTREWLVDRCPRCSGRLGWYRTAGLAVCDALTCQFDLSSSEPSYLDEQRFSTAAPIARLLDPAPAVHEPALAVLPPAVRDLGRGSAFELAWRLGRATLKEGMATRDEHKSLPHDAIVDGLCAGASLLDDWPHSIERHFRTLVATGQDEAAMSFVSTIRKLCNHRQSWADHRTLVSASLPHLVTTDRRAYLVASKDGVDGAAAVEILGTAASTLVRARKRGLLATSAAAGSVNVHAVFSRAELEEVRLQLEDRMRSGSLAERLGITRHGVEQLVCLGSIAAVRGAFVRELYSGLQVSTSSVDALIRQLEAAADSSIADDPESIPLRRALMMIGGREKPWGPIMVALRDGIVPFGLAQGSTFSSRIRIRPESVTWITDAAFDRSHHDFEFAAELNRRDAQELLNLTPVLMMTALDEELGKARADGRSLHLVPVLDIARGRISGGEILARWGDGRRMPPPLRDRRRFRRLGVTGWSRHEIETALREMTVRRKRSNSHRGSI